MMGAFLRQRLERADAPLLKAVDLRGKQREGEAEQADGERPAQPFERAAIGNPHRPLAVGDAQHLVVRVPAHLAVAKDERRRRAVARVNLQPRDRIELWSQHRRQQVARAKGGIDEGLDRLRAGRGRIDVGLLRAVRIALLRAAGIDRDIDEEARLLFLRLLFLHQFQDAGRRRAARLPRAPHRLAPDRVAEHVIAERVVAARRIGFDQDDGKADRLVRRGPDRDGAAVIFAQHRLGGGGLPPPHRDADADPFHAGRAHLRLKRGEIGADAGTARSRVGLIERAHAFEHGDMVAKAHVDLHGEAARAVGLFRLIIEKARRGGDDRREQDDQPDEADQQRQQTICPKRRAHCDYPV